MFTMDNTQGYTQNELDALNQELETRLVMAAMDKGDELTPDERHEIITHHEHEVAQR